MGGNSAYRHCLKNDKFAQQTFFFSLKWPKKMLLILKSTRDQNATVEKTVNKITTLNDSVFFPRHSDNIVFNICSM